MRRSFDQIRIASGAMLLLGTISLVVSMDYNSYVLAFIGLGLAFWGAILFYVRPEEYAKKALLEAALSPSLVILNQMTQELGYKGDVTYLPPRYFAHTETMMYISRHKDACLPTPEQVRKYESKVVARTTRGMLLTPPGIELSRLLEKALGKSFVGTDLDGLQQELPGLFKENLEIAENLEIQAEYNRTVGNTGDTTFRILFKNITIHAKITKSIYQHMFKEAERPSQLIGSIGCPICSAIAIALTKATGKPVRIVDTKSSGDGNVLEAMYEIIEG